jgi:hypothetical protein
MQLTTTSDALLRTLRQPKPPAGALLDGLHVAAAQLRAMQDQPERDAGSALAALHIALAQDELAPLGAPPTTGPSDQADLPALLVALADALHRIHGASGHTAMLNAARHVTAAGSALSPGTAA